MINNKEYIADGLSAAVKNGKLNVNIDGKSFKIDDVKLLAGPMVDNGSGISVIIHPEETARYITVCSLLKNGSWGLGQVNLR